MWYDSHLIVWKTGRHCFVLFDQYETSRTLGKQVMSGKRCAEFGYIYWYWADVLHVGGTISSLGTESVHDSISFWNTVIFKDAGRKYIRGTQTPTFPLQSWGQELSNGIWHPYIAQYRHVIYRWKALELIFPMTRGTQTCHCVLPPGVPDFHQTNSLGSVHYLCDTGAGWNWGGGGYVTFFLLLFSSFGCDIDHKQSKVFVWVLEIRRHTKTKSISYSLFQWFSIISQAKLFSNLWITYDSPF